MSDGHGHSSGHDEDFFKKYVMSIEEVDAFLRSLEWRHNEAYNLTIDNLAKKGLIRKGPNGEPLWEDFDKEENHEAIGHEFANSYFEIGKKELSLKDEIADKYKHEIIQLMGGKSAPYWVQDVRQHGRNLTPLVHKESAQKHKKAVSDQKMEVVLSPLLNKATTKEGRHEILKRIGLEEIIGTDDEPQEPGHVVGKLQQYMGSPQGQHEYQKIVKEYRKGDQSSHGH